MVAARPHFRQLLIAMWMPDIFKTAWLGVSRDQFFDRDRLKDADEKRDALCPKPAVCWRLAARQREGPVSCSADFVCSAVD